tara:strand:+ start:101341 stop:101793 length:453 start_codon:yes stop_codon:yes gene_type:complete
MYNFEIDMSQLKITIINGPNLNLLGVRQPEIYGVQTFNQYYSSLQNKFPNVEFSYYQSNSEGSLVDFLQEIGFSEVCIILNAGGYTHTSVAIADAVAAISAKVIEVHLSHPAAREEQRHISLLSKYATGSITGLGLYSYEAAIQYYIYNL